MIALENPKDELFFPFNCLKTLTDCEIYSHIT